METIDEKRFALRELTESRKCIGQAMGGKGLGGTLDKAIKLKKSYQELDTDLWNKLCQLKKELLSGDLDVS
jgi:hypothetical protein